MKNILLLFFSLFCISCNYNANQPIDRSEKAELEINSNSELAKDSNIKSGIAVKPSAKSEGNSITLKFINGKTKDIMDFDPIITQLKKENVIYPNGGKNQAIIDLVKASTKEKNDLLEQGKFFYENSIEDADYLSFNATTGPLLMKETAMGLLFQITAFKKSEFPNIDDKNLGSASQLVFLNQEGEKKLEISGIGSGLAALTDNANFFMTKHGGSWGDGGSQHLQDIFEIYNIQNGNLLFTTTNLPNEPSFSQRGNYFTLVDYISVGNKRLFVFDPKNEMVYSQNFPDSSFVHFIGFNDKAMILKDGSELNFKTEWNLQTFDEYKTANLFGDYQNLTEYR